MNEVDNIIKETKSHLWVRKYFIRGVSSFFAICFVTCIATLLKELLSCLYFEFLDTFFVLFPCTTALLFSRSNATQYPRNATNTNMNIESIHITIAVGPPVDIGVFSITALKIVTNTSIMVMKIATLAFASPGGITKLAQEAMTHNPDVDM